MFRRTLGIVLMASLAITLSACESAKKVISNSKDAPDEFVVYQRPPLSLPPEFSLRPPAPGTTGPQAITPTDQARAALLQQAPQIKDRSQSDPNLSDGLNAIMAKTGANVADPTIREVVNAETNLLSKEDQRLADKMIFWVDDKPYEGTVVDAVKEQQRIQENQALGKPITEGETPQVKKSRGTKGLLEF
ncbi:MAG: DUF3035 domain-containing protein [Rhodospirillales bacterium]|nr:DUF3035 domain-containing protein [Rhodospirillales bacterium]MBO6788568.1 DUF3035 domain-containing protein [Rhodospirillales bacterium]